MRNSRERRGRRWYWAPVVAAVASGVLTPLSAVADTESIPCEVAAHAGAAPGAVITDAGGLSLEAPPAGAGVVATSYGDDDIDSLVVSRTSEGELVVSDCGADEVEGADATAEAKAPSPGACRDHAFKLYGFRWQEPYRWRFNASTTPDELTKEEAEQALMEGVNAITDVHTDCGIPDDVTATHAYQGRGGGRADFKGARCRAFGRTDGASVMDFGNLPDSKLAKTCFYFLREPGLNVATEADVRFNKARHEWARGAGGPGCRNKYSLRAVAAHEAGHVFGLAHVKERKHGELTMSKFSNGPCQESEYTLGRGDVEGLRRLYGPAATPGGGPK